MKTVLQPAGWPRPRGYANGVVRAGPPGVRRRHGRLERRGASSRATTSSTRCARRCANVKAVLAEAGARPEHMVRMTWYVVDRADYLARGRDIGAAYREVMGHYDVAMSAVQVSALMEARAKVEIEVTAVVPQAL